MIIPELQRLHRAHGFVPRGELAEVAARLQVPLYRVHEVASFYPQFRTTPPPEIEVRVCRDMSCRLRGAADVRRVCEAVAGQHPPARLAVEGVSCLGRCDRAPAMTVELHRPGREGETRLYTGYSPAEARALLHGLLGGGAPPSDLDADHDDGRAWEMDLYRGKPDYAAVSGLLELLRAPLAEANDARRQVIERLRIAGLLGMGGAGGRTFKKWSDVWTAAGDEKYVVCCGDESEPGTFKDREILLRTPHLVLEGVLIAGLVVGARRGYVYIRHEYPEQVARMQAAIAAAAARGVLAFPVEVFVSPGGYICGEQTAMIQVLEDKRAEPRNRPPELQTNGLFDKPTLVNNVETLAWVPSLLIARETANLRMFSLSGDVESPGVYEVENGITLGALIARAGGMRGGQAFKAVAPSGASGGFLPRFLDGPSGRFDVLDWKLEVQGARDLGLMLGGGIVVYGEDADLVDQALGCLEFFRNESCGKCAPCRIGTQKLVELTTRIRDGSVRTESIYGAEASVGRTLTDLAAAMRDTAICGLGTVAANPMRSLLRHFQADVERRTARR
jgi:NADH:ubiquinone oxidoreductase subunit F (NADH-binding)/NADH:ubiquinone oxidoreductase subunit E